MKKIGREAERGETEVEVERQRLEGNGILKLKHKMYLHLPHQLQRGVVHWKTKVHP